MNDAPAQVQIQAAVFTTMETALITYATTHFNATLIDTTTLTHTQVARHILDVVRLRLQATHARTEGGPDRRSHRAVTVAGGASRDCPPTDRRPEPGAHNLQREQQRLAGRTPASTSPTVGMRRGTSRRARPGLGLRPASGWPRTDSYTNIDRSFLQ
jgi:hypothetical protein